MATTTVAAAGTALALYYYARKNPGLSGEANETHASAHSAPKSFLEDIYFFAEAMRYTYGETFGRWRTVDLLVGLSYLSRKGTEEHPVADVARHGHVYALDSVGAERQESLALLARIERFFRYCSGLRERRPIFQRRYLIEILGIPDQDILLQELRAGVLKPSYILTRDESLHAIVLAVRGTHSFKDAFTSLTGASKPHHVVDSNGVVLGYSHFGMLAAARWLKTQVVSHLEAALLANPGYKLYLVGHSLGGGTAAMLTMMLRESGGVFSDATCTAIACPACMTLELAKSCSGYVTTIIHGADVIPTISPGSADALRDEVARSSWGTDFRQDLRSSSIVRAVESGIRGVSSATATASTWTATRISACYQRRSFAIRTTNKTNLIGGTNGGTVSVGAGAMPLKRRNSDGDLAEAVNDHAGGTAAAAGMSSAGVSSRLRRGTSLETGTNVRDLADAAIMIKDNSQIVGGDDANGKRKFTAHSSTSAHGVPNFFNIENNNEMGSNTSIAPDQIDSMEIEYASKEYYENEELIEGSDDDSEGINALGLGSEECSLEAEASVRMREVAQAVSAAECEEAAAAAAGELDDVTVPSIIRPGVYGGGAAGTGGPSRSSIHRGDDSGGLGGGRNNRKDSSRDLAWRRMMYPAGRIMHLVPARLVPGLHWESRPATPSTGAGTEAAGGDSEAGGELSKVCTIDKNAWPEAIMEEGDEYPVPASPYPSFKRRNNNTSRNSEAATKEVEISIDKPSHSRQLSELSLKDMVTAEEAAGSAASGRASDYHGPLPPLKPPIGPPPEPMVLLDQVPQEAYGRIKLCRTVLSDHVIPNYLRSLASFLERL